jgi:hypothetical protein
MYALYAVLRPAPVTLSPGITMTRSFGPAAGTAARRGELVCRNYTDLLL